MARSSRARSTRPAPTPRSTHGGSSGLADPIGDSDRVDALTKVTPELVRRHFAGEPGGSRVIDVLNLSMGYYHETPQDKLFDQTLYDLLKVLGDCGTAVVCSAGNDATARPQYPRRRFCAVVHHGGGKRTSPDPRPCSDRVRRRAQPQRHGGSLQQYRPLGAVLRTRRQRRQHHAPVPGWSGADRPDPRLRPAARVDRPRQLQASGFALWSGSSFAAPRIAGLIAAAPAAAASTRRTTTRADAVQRGWAAVAALTDITP